MGSENKTGLHTPCNICVQGANMVGKTHLVVRMLQQANTIFDPSPEKILYCYSEWQDSFDLLQETVPNIEFYQGVPPATFIDEWSATKRPQLVCLDDLMMAICNSAEMVQLFTVKCHHRQITTISILHSLFPPGKHSKTLSLNYNYFLLFQNYRDRMQVSYFGKQLFASNVAYFLSAYQKATSRKWGYLLVDLHAKSDPQFRLRTNILKGEGDPLIYVPKV